MYSKWHKVDFHIHTDKSSETKPNDYSGTFDTTILLDQLRKNDIGMFSLTDHNIINSEAYEQISTDCAPMKCFVGVELDLAINFVGLKRYVSARIAGTSCSVKPFHAIFLFESSNHSSISTILESMYVNISSELSKNAIKADMASNKQLRVTTFEYIVRYFNNENFIVIAHGNKKKGACATYGKSGAEDELLYNIILGDVSALEMKSNLKKRNAIEFINKKLNKLQNGDILGSVPWVCFSDNHNCSTYALREQITWIKGSRDFETLRLAFSDHESRIHTSNIEPTHVSDYIDSVKFKLINQNEQEIILSPHLNVLIGGRSSGKSLLFNTIISLNDSIQPAHKHEFKQNYSALIVPESLKIKKCGDSDYRESVSCASDVYCQEDIIKMFKEDSSLPTCLPGYFEEIDPITIQENENYVDSMMTDLKLAYRNIYEKNSKANVGDIKRLFELSIIVTKQLIKTDQALFPRLKDDIYNNLLSALHNTLMWLKKIKHERFENSTLFLPRELMQIEAVITNIEQKLVQIDSYSKRTLCQIRFFTSVKQIYNHYVVSSLTQEMRQIDESRRDLNSRLDDIRDYFSSVIRLRIVCDNIGNCRIKAKIHEKRNEHYKFISTANNCFSGKMVEELLNEKIHNYNAGNTLFENLLSLSNVNIPLVRIRNISAERGKLPDELNRKIDDFLSNTRSDISYEIIELGGQSVSTASTSQGKKSSIFLDVKLTDLNDNGGFCLLMIDQPEDNLDNKFMSSSLIKQLRKLKKTVQIIFVTHNPSIAIFGDAENIIIADNNDGKITYQQGGLENIRIRNEACEILDGGVAAFRNRMQKYSISLIKDSEEV